MRRLFGFLFQLVIVAVFFFLCTSALIIFDGLNDQGQKADVALVTGHAQVVAGQPNPLLDRVVDLYNAGDFSFIILSGSTGGGAGDEPAAMAEYLERHGIPPGVVIRGRKGGESTQETASRVAEIMKLRQFKSVMIVADYYHITRTRLVLSHEGIAEVERAHVGRLQKEDAVKIAREVVALYVYVGKTYLLPAAEKVKKEAEVGIDKVDADAVQAKDKVNKGLDNMAK